MFVVVEVGLGWIGLRWLIPASAGWWWLWQGIVGWLLVGPWTRLALMLGSLVLSYRGRSPALYDRGFSWASYLRFCLREYLAFLLFFSVLQPLAWLLPRPAKSPTPKGGPSLGEPPTPGTAPQIPVILLHGFFCNRAFWLWLQGPLNKAGYPTYALDLEPLLGDLDAFARQMASWIDQVCEGTGARQVFVVAHSMGGLVTRAALLQPETRAKVAGVITLGTPHHGTQTAALSFGIGTNLRQMQIDSPWLRALEAAEAQIHAHPPLVCLYCPQDQIVAPQESAILSRATDAIALDGIGHMGLSIAPAVLQTILQVFARWEAKEMRKTEEM